jgi:hypothetical protein
MPTIAKWLSRAAIDPNDPLRLKVAAEIAFPDGTMTEHGLRREAARGRLVIERIAGKQYTTLAAVERMRMLCRVDQKGHASTYVNERAETRSSSSSMEKTKSGQAAALRIAEGLKKRSKSTSDENIVPIGATVVPLK